MPAVKYGEGSIFVGRIATGGAPQMMASWRKNKMLIYFIITRKTISVSILSQFAWLQVILAFKGPSLEL